MTRLSRLLTAAALPCLLALPAATQTIPTNVTFRNFFKTGDDSLVFNRPILVKPYPAEDSAFIVLQQNGRIVTVRWESGMWRKTDSAAVTVFGGTGGNDEQGLLGFAFHPNYAQNGKYYIYFEEGVSSGGGGGGFPGGGFGNTQRFNMLAERTAGESRRPSTDDPQRTILRLPDPYDNHNGGTINFDKEGYLVAGIGDGGTIQGDPQNRAQNLDSLHGKFLRLDVNGDDFPDDTTRNYAIPAGNPFATSGGRPEIFAYGARNPFKWSFHPLTGELWLGEVGQWDWEKISRVPNGSNLGWPFREGNACFKPEADCPGEGLQRPVLTLPSTQASCIIGGTFFLGPVSAFNGTYIFGDFGTSRVWAARVQGDTLVNLTEIGTVSRVVSFDRDREGRILVSAIGTNATNGRVLVLESPDMLLGPVSVSGRPAADMRPAITWAMVRENPGRYVVTTLDGKAVRGTPSGAVLVRDRLSGEAPRLMSVVR